MPGRGVRTRAFSIMLAEILKLYGQATLRIIINFQVIKKTNSTVGGEGGRVGWAI